MSSVHEKQKPFQCSLCDAKFTRKNSLDRHISSIHEQFRIDEFLGEENVFEFPAKTTDSFIEDRDEFEFLAQTTESFIEERNEFEFPAKTISPIISTTLNVTEIYCL